MNSKAKRMLKAVQAEIANMNFDQMEDNPNAMMNYIANHCNHPIYYFHGFYQNADLFTNEGPKMVSKQVCNYALLQCLECGDYLPIYRPEKEPKRYNWATHLGKKPLEVVRTNEDYDILRRQYFMYCCEKSNLPKYFSKKL